MKKFLKGIYFYYICICICLKYNIIKSVRDLDEIWNYNVARNIAKGLIPYKDISTITTPFCQCLIVCFKIFADELIVMRVLASALITAIVYAI